MADAPPPSPGTLYVVATPIGNLEDITFRAVRILREVAVIAAEDTRVTRKLLSHFDIHTPLTSYHSHTDPRKVEALVGRLAAGEDVALVSDAGTPGISDPGSSLISAALEAGVPVVPVPGPSALAAAVSVSGLDTTRVTFVGFLPRKAGERRREVEALRPLPHTLVFYESPERLVGFLEALREILGDRQAVVAREITKKFEEFARGRLSDLEAHFTQRGVRGECAVLVAGSTDPLAAAAEGDGIEEPETVLRRLLAAGMSVRDASRRAAEETHRPRKELYALAARLAESPGPEEPVG